MADPLALYKPGERVLSRSVFDRLLDSSPDRQQDATLSLVEQVRETREAIRRDLEALLNTRRRPTAPQSSFTELKDALVCYGVDGIISANLVTDESKSALARAIEQRIALFETRLSDVRVTILKNAAVGERALRMRIQGAFRLYEGMPPISFESTIDPSTQRFMMEEVRG